MSQPLIWVIESFNETDWVSQSVNETNFPQQQTSQQSDSDSEFDSWMNEMRAITFTHSAYEQRQPYVLV